MARWHSLSADHTFLPFACRSGAGAASFAIGSFIPEIEVTKMRQIARVFLVAAGGLLLAIAANAQSNDSPVVKLAVAPSYPALALALPKGTDVSVDITVDKNGDVITANAVEGSPLLFQAALSAARKWKFASEATSTIARLTFSFKVLPKDAPDEEATAIFMPPYHLEVRRKLPEPTVNYGEKYLGVGETWEPRGVFPAFSRQDFSSLYESHPLFLWKSS
jgi:TonB family protein